MLPRARSRDNRMRQQFEAWVEQQPGRKPAANGMQFGLGAAAFAAVAAGAHKDVLATTAGLGGCSRRRSSIVPAWHRMDPARHADVGGKLPGGVIEPLLQPQDLHKTRGRRQNPPGAPGVRWHTQRPTLLEQAAPPSGA